MKKTRAVAAMTDAANAPKFVWCLPRCRVVPPIDCSMEKELVDVLAFDSRGVSCRRSSQRRCDVGCFAVRWVSAC
jgi:hypothetical protein